MIPLQLKKEQPGYILNSLIAARLKEFIDAGKKGAATGEGFYKYN